MGSSIKLHKTNLNIKGSYIWLVTKKFENVSVILQKAVEFEPYFKKNLIKKRILLRK